MEPADYYDESYLTLLMLRDQGKTAEEIIYVIKETHQKRHGLRVAQKTAQWAFDREENGDALRIYVFEICIDKTNIQEAYEVIRVKLQDDAKAIYFIYSFLCLSKLIPDVVMKYARRKLWLVVLMAIGSFIVGVGGVYLNIFLADGGRIALLPIALTIFSFIFSGMGIWFIFTSLRRVRKFIGV